MDEATVTPWDIAVDLFGDMQGIHAKMGAGEAASHLAELAAAGYVDRVGNSPVTYMESIENESDGASVDTIVEDVFGATR